ncbi:RloB family protein [Helicobacter sp.]|uniref:RloB family protein n=1 Tax=Helicobacter sp. TaxID=218 RepID=UPI002A751D84|nr:RloB family protein [Helicobacter sp.]MDY2585701.1 RloB family protein [Helicobacter sp.]
MPFKRRQPTKEINPLIYIFCEGETEQNYFQALKKDKRINLEIKCAKHSAPRSILKEAEKILQKEEAGSIAEDRIYCVYDTDNKCEGDIIPKENIPEKIKIILSKPCFEFWVLLHFMPAKTTPCFANCKEVETRLNEKISEYNKRNKTKLKSYDKPNYDFASILPLTQKALKNAKEAAKEFQKDNKTQPYTDIFEIIESIESIS